MTISMDVETDALRANVAALSAMTRKTAQQSVRDASIMILQAGTKVVPQAKIAKRKIVRAVRRYRRGVEELAIDARPEAPGDKALYLIARPRNRKPIGKSGGRKFWTFETMAAARDHQAVTFRGVAKAGFWAQYPALGRAIPGKYTRQGFLADVPGLKETQTLLQDMVPSITVTNKSTAIGFERSDYWKRSILSSVNNRISGTAKANEKRLAAFRQAGGVAWDSRANEYMPLTEE